MLLADGRILPDSALAETTPVLSNGYFYAQDGLQLAQLYATYAQLYRAQPWVHTVVGKVSTAFSRLPVNVWDITRDSGKVLVNDCAYGRLMAKPSTRMSPYAFYRWIASTFETYGEAFIYKQRNARGEVMNLLPMHPSRTIVKRDMEGNLVYRFTLGIGTAGILDAPESDVIPFLRYNPNSSVRGMSRLEALRMTLLNEDASRRATASFWEKGARPGTYLKVDKQLSDKAKARLATDFANLHAGVDNVGRAVVLEEGMDAITVQLSMEEMQYIDGRKLNREEVTAVYDVPPPAVHILDRATFSNITENLRSMYRDTMAPRVIEMESVFDTYLRPEFDRDGSLRANWDMSDVTRGDFEVRAEAAQKLVQSGLMKPSEGRLMFDLPDAGPEADALYGNAALVRLGTSTKGSVGATAPVGVDQATDIKSRADAMGVLIRSGVEPDAAAAAVGLTGLPFLDGVPVTIRLNDGSSDTAKATDAEVDTVTRSVAGVLGRATSAEELRTLAVNLITAGSDSAIVESALAKALTRFKEQP